MQWTDRLYEKTYTTKSKMKDIGVYLELELNEIVAYYLTVIQSGYIGYAIEYIALAKKSKKAYFPCCIYKTTVESVKKSNHG